MGRLIIMEQTFAILGENYQKQLLSVATVKETEKGVKYLIVKE